MPSTSLNLNQIDMDIQKKNNRSVSYMKAEVRDVLRTKTPNGWFKTIHLRIKKPGMQKWLASIGTWNYPNHKGWGTKLDELSSWYRSDLNTNTSKELEEAFTLLGWPYRKGASDDAVPSAKKHEIKHDKVVNSQSDGHPEAWRYCKYHDRQKINLEGVAG